MKKLDRTSFQAWLSGRIRNASRGQILDHETGEYVQIETAPARVLLEHTRRRGQKIRDSHQLTVEKKALDQAKADPNDPFSYARCKAHLENGTHELEDYDVEFKRITVDMLDLISGEVIGRKMADVPMKVRRP